ncbi:response regulator [Paenibacillus sp. HN-1]|uniref:response regulator transcription factor n=1 Tax=Paenibacillus TaxID=44249 RepID=UPI001CA8CFB4|nr:MULTISPECIES: response regulator [Paenibacillus]MBY9079107.1 response regulator [Paenibacillus sp. CGMCC 1.18879]MBY9086885.1 response regulator [Paenibacillus sinensis]
MAQDLRIDRPLKVLIVDDEQLVRKGLKMTVEWGRHGMTVVDDAPNGALGWEKVIRHEPDVVITDIVMPEMDGIELAQKIRHCYPHIKILFLSCHRDFAYAQQGIQIGISDYIVKTSMGDEEMERCLDKIRRECRSVPAARVTETAIADDGETVTDWLRRQDVPASAKLSAKLEKEWNWMISQSCILHVYDIGSVTNNSDIASAERRDRLKDVSQEQAGGFVLTEQAGGLVLTEQAGRRSQEEPEQRPLEESEQRSLEESEQRSLEEGRQSMEEPERQLYRLLAPDFASGIPGRALFPCPDGSALLLCPWDERDLAEHELLNVKLARIPGLEWRGDGPVEGVMRWTEGVMRLLRLRAIERETPLSSRQHKEDIYRAIDYINRHLQLDPRAGEIADRIGVSRSYFSTVFKEATGCSLIDFITRKKLERAQSLLEMTDYRIEEIAEKAGIGDVKYFAKWFKKSTGFAPGQYRQQTKRH